jgi:hypothetical protein
LIQCKYGQTAQLSSQGGIEEDVARRGAGRDRWPGRLNVYARHATNACKRRAKQREGKQAWNGATHEATGGITRCCMTHEESGEKSRTSEAFGKQL